MTMRSAGTKLPSFSLIPGLAIERLCQHLGIELEFDPLRAVIGGYVLRDRWAQGARHDARLEFDDRYIAVAQRSARGNFHSDDAAAE